MDSDNILTFCPLFRSRNRTILPNNSKLLPNCIFTTKNTWKILMLLLRIQRAEHDPSLVKDEHRPTFGRILSGAVRKKRRVYFHYISLVQSMQKYTFYISCNVHVIDQENFFFFFHLWTYFFVPHLKLYPVWISQFSTLLENISMYIFLVATVYFL